MRKDSIALIAGLALLGAAALAAGFAAGTRPPSAERPSERRAIADVDLLRSRLRASIARDGLEAAYAALKADATEDTAARHGAAHVFGELAYERGGVDAIRLCDASMTFGCYHGLIVRALAKEGLAALPKIDAACRAAHGEDDTGCRHGIGHGLVEYYSPRDLEDALDRCATLQPPGLLGCTQGAFMDYANAAAEDPALVDREDPSRPCSAVSDAYRPSCYFEQPYFWMLRAGFDAATAARSCAALADPSQKEACLLGLGRAAAELGGYDAGAAERACAALGADDRVGCLAGAHWLFAAVGKPRPWPCERLADGDKAACVARSKAISDVGQ